MTQSDLAALEQCRREQTAAGNVIRKGGRDIEWAKRTAEDWLMEEALIRLDIQ